LTALELSILSNTRQFMKGVGQDVPMALDKVADSLDEVARDGEKAGDKLERTFREAADSAKRESRKIGRSFEDNSTQGFHRAGQSAQSFREEAIQNFSEVTSSFDGSMQSLQDLAQGTFGGLASGIAGPIGLAAGGVAVGIGLIGTAIQGLGDDTEADKANVAEWTQAYIDAGSTILTSAQSTAKALEIITDPEKFKTAEASAKDWGVTTATAIAALAGQQWAIDAVSSSVGDMNTQLDAFGKTDVAPTSETLAQFENLSDQYSRAESRLTELTTAMDDGAQRADVYSQYLTELAENTGGATTKIDKFGDSLYSLPDGTKIYIDAETGQATTEVDAIEKQIYGLSGTAEVNVDTTKANRDLEALLRKTRTVDVGIRFKDQVGRTYR
jgi:hypothetical protein